MGPRERKFALSPTPTTAFILGYMGLSGGSMLSDFDSMQAELAPSSSARQSSDDNSLARESDPLSLSIRYPLNHGSPHLQLLMNHNLAAFMLRDLALSECIFRIHDSVCTPCWAFNNGPPSVSC
jgi:hypothetical protein